MTVLICHHFIYENYIILNTRHTNAYVCLRHIFPFFYMYISAHIDADHNCRDYILEEKSAEKQQYLSPSILWINMQIKNDYKKCNLVSKVNYHV